MNAKNIAADSSAHSSDGPASFERTVESRVTLASSAAADLGPSHVPQSGDRNESRHRLVMEALIKQRRSKLAPYEETLFQMAAEAGTLAEMQTWLAGRGVTISTVAISKFLASRRRRRWQAQVLGKIASGVQPAEDAKAALQTNARVRP